MVKETLLIAEAIMVKAIKRYVTAKYIYEDHYKYKVDMDRAIRITKKIYSLALNNQEDIGEGQNVIIPGLDIPPLHMYDANDFSKAIKFAFDESISEETKKEVMVQWYNAEKLLDIAQFRDEKEKETYCWLRDDNGETKQLSDAFSGDITVEEAFAIAQDAYDKADKYGMVDKSIDEIIRRLRILNGDYYYYREGNKIICLTRDTDEYIEWNNTPEHLRDYDYPAYFEIYYDDKEEFLASLMILCNGRYARHDVIDHLEFRRDIPRYFSSFSYMGKATLRYDIDSLEERYKTEVNKDKSEIAEKIIEKRSDNTEYESIAFEMNRWLTAFGKTGTVTAWGDTFILTTNSMVARNGYKVFNDKNEMTQFISEQFNIPHKLFEKHLYLNC